MKKWITSGLAALTALAVLASPVAALSHPVLWKGARGTDVATAQQLLRHHGIEIPVTGYYGSITQQKVREFQARTGLAVDGVIGPNTWSRLAPTLRLGSRGPAVRALQQALNVKHQYGLAVDGIFGPRTEAAVRDFQAHMGLAVDGIVGPNTWRELSGHFEELPDEGVGFYRYRVNHTDSSWGTGNTVANIKRVAWWWTQRGHDVRIGINDISKPHGGYFYPHKSHRYGRDVDIRPSRRDGLEAPVGWMDWAYSRELTQELVDLLWSTGEVERILFNDPHIRGVQPWPGHDHHLHVRFRR